jgi:soluble lytic murein transglycosylase-like protein
VPPAPTVAAQAQIRRTACNRRLANLINEVEGGQVIVEMKCPRCGSPHLGDRPAPRSLRPTEAMKLRLREVPDSGGDVRQLRLTNRSIATAGVGSPLGRASGIALGWYGPTPATPTMFAGRPGSHGTPQPQGRLDQGTAWLERSSPPASCRVLEPKGKPPATPRLDRDYAKPGRGCRTRWFRHSALLVPALPRRGPTPVPGLGPERPIREAQFIERDGALYVTNVAPAPSGGVAAAALPAAPPVRRRHVAGAAASYQPLIGEITARHAVPAKLVESVIRVESGFDPRAVSHRGARGLMQLMPATAEQLGLRDVFDARQNIEGGVRHLRRLLDRYGDSPPGPRRLQRWREGGGESRRYSADQRDARLRGAGAPVLRELGATSTGSESHYRRRAGQRLPGSLRGARRHHRLHEPAGGVAAALHSRPARRKAGCGGR